MLISGICLYNKFKTKEIKGKHKTYFIWENIKPNSKRVLFSKQMFGYSQKGKQYPGLLNKFNGKRLGKGCISIPLEHAKTIHQLFKKHKITVKIKNLLEIE